MPASFQKCLTDLVRICESTKWAQSPEAASQTMVDTLAEVLECDLAFIHLLDAPGDCLIKQASHGEIPANITSNIRLSKSTGRMLQMMRSHEPIIMDFLHPNPADQIPNGSTMFRSVMSVPLLVGDETLGMFSIVYKNYIDWTKDDIKYLLAIGRLLGMAVQHAKIARKYVDLEILLERKRLSREIHDQFSQLVNTMNMGVETALLSWGEDDTERLRNDLERIKTVGQEAAGALREEMLFLRHPASETEGLVQTIRECLKRFESQWKIDTYLQVEDGLEPLIVSTQTELQFMRILHEAFSNIIRHSTASQVRVLLEGNRDRLLMCITDDGQGFDPEVVSPERLGLRIMRERTESLGGVMNVESSTETGTMISVEVPLYPL